MIPERAPAPVPAGDDGAPLRTRPSTWPDRPDDAWIAALAARGTPVGGPVRVVDGTALQEVTFLHRPRRDGTRVMVHLNSLTDRHREDVSGALLAPVAGTSWHALTYLLPPDLVCGYRILERPAHELPADIGARRPGWVQVRAWGEADRLNPHRMGQDESASSVWAGPSARLHPEWAPEPTDASGGAVGGASDGSPAGAVGGAPGDFPATATGWDLVRDLEGLDRRTTLAVRRGARAAEGAESSTAGAPVGTPEGADAPEERRLLILLDGETWRSHDVLRRLAGRASHWDLLLVDNDDRDQRARDLPDPERAAALVQRSVEAASAAVGRTWPPERTVLAGQSFGGLATANVVLRRPDLASCGIAQSGSYWFGADAPPGEGEGELLRRLASEERGRTEGPVGAEGADAATGTRRAGGMKGVHRPVGGDGADGAGGTRGPARAEGAVGRLIVQVGTEEDDMVTGSLQLARLLAGSPGDGAAGRLLHLEIVRGGHDYAWWRHGLSRGLDRIEEIGPAATARARGRVVVSGV